MWEYAAIRDQIAALFAQQLHLDVASAETDLVETGILDSLKFVELLFELEKHFGRKISLEDLEVDNFRSIRRIAEFIAHRNGTNARE